MFCEYSYKVVDEFQRFFQIVWTFIAPLVAHYTSRLTSCNLFIYLLALLGSFTADCALLVLRYFIPCLYSSCDRKANLRGNSFPQTPHEYCILSACACAFTLWQTKFDIWLKPLPQSSHLYGRSFVCVNTWLRKLPEKSNVNCRIFQVHRWTRFTSIYTIKHREILLNLGGKNGKE